jgi:antitoxin PrlF
VLTSEEQKGLNMASKKQMECCRIESVVTIDERGQMVLPKDVRDRAGIKPGDKLAVVAVSAEDKVCCITLIKADALSGPVKVIMKPMFGAAEAEEK